MKALLKLPPPPPPSHPPHPSKHKSRPLDAPKLGEYNRYDQEVYNNTEMDEFQIKTGMSFRGMFIIILHMPVTLLKHIFSGVSFSKSTTSKPPPQDPRQASSSLKRLHPSVTNSSIESIPKKRTSRTPIIIVPESEKALITMYNAMDILQVNLS